MHLRQESDKRVFRDAVCEAFAAAMKIDFMRLCFFILERFEVELGRFQSTVDQIVYSF